MQKLQVGTVVPFIEKWTDAIFPPSTVAGTATEVAPAATGRVTRLRSAAS